MKGKMDYGNKCKNSMVGGGMKEHLPSSNGPTASHDGKHSSSGKHLDRIAKSEGNKSNPGSAPR